MIAPVKEKDSKNGDYDVDFTLAIVTDTRPEYTSTQRYTNNYDAILTPIYDSLIDQICQCVNIWQSNPRKIKPDKLDNLFIDGKKLIMPDNLDAIIVEFKDIQVCNTFVADGNPVTTFTLTTSTGAGGTIEPSPSTQLYESGTIVPINATPASGYRFLKWVVNGVNVLTSLTYVVVEMTSTAIASFIKQWLVTTSVSGAGTITPTTGLTDEGNITIEVTVTNPLVDEFEKIEITPDGEATQTVTTNHYTWALNKAVVIVGYVKAQFTTIMDVFSTAPTLVGVNYVYEGGLNDMVVKGSNYIKFDATKTQYLEIESITITDGDTLEFYARQDNNAIDGALFSNSSSGQFKFANNSNNFFINVGSFGTWATGVDTKTWNKYKIYFDVVGLRVGLSVNGGAITYKAVTNYSLGAIDRIARIALC